MFEPAFFADDVSIQSGKKAPLCHTVITPRGPLRDFRGDCSGIKSGGKSG